MENKGEVAGDRPKWNVWTRIWFVMLGVVGVVPWIGVYEQITKHDISWVMRYFKASDWLMLVTAIVWDLFLFKLVRSHVKLALLLFDGLNCLIGIAILLGEKGNVDGWLISSFCFGIAFVTWLFARNSLRKDTIWDSIEEIKGM